MKFNPYLEIIIGSIICGTNGIFIKLLNLPPTTLSFFRLAVPTVALFVYFKLKGRNLFAVENKALMFFASFIFGIKTMLMMLGFQFAPLSTAVIVMYTWPIFATIFGVLILKERIIKRNVYLLILAFIGIIFIFFTQNISFGNLEFLGLLFMLIVAIIHAFVMTIFKKQFHKNSKYETIFYQNVVGFFMFLPFIFINPLPTLVQTGFGITYGTLIGLVAYIFFFSALRRIKVSTYSHITYVEVISAVIFGLIIFRETLTWNVIVGGLLIISSTYLLKR